MIALDGRTLPTSEPPMAQHYPPSPANEFNGMLELVGTRYRFKVYGQSVDWQSIETFDNVAQAAQAWYSRKLELELVSS